MKVTNPLLPDISPYTYLILSIKYQTESNINKEVISVINLNTRIKEVEIHKIKQ